MTTSHSTDRLLKAAIRLRAVKLARTRLMPFIQLTMPDPEDVEDATLSLYEETPLARTLCELMERVAVGEEKRVAVSVGPQQGKSTVISVAFPAWIAGRFPHTNLILGTYSQEFAEEWGGKVRAVMQSPAYRQIFPGTELKAGEKSKSLLVTTSGGRLAFAGREGATTGKAADIFIVDDAAAKDAQEASSPTIRRHVWEWFNSVAMTRCHSHSGICVVHTRWNQDDLIGRLCDPEHPDHDPEIAKLWTYLNIPTVVTDKKLADALGLELNNPVDKEVIAQFGDKPMAAIWQSRKGLQFLAEVKRMDPSGFEALYQGNPTPEDGDYFRREWIIPYTDPKQIPTNLRKYAASDHAISSKQERDASCMGVVGIDEQDEIWVLPDVYWEREEDTSVLVDEIIQKILFHKPQIWWAEREHISKSIRPFLMKRMVEMAALGTLIDDSIVPSQDLKIRARSIQGMMALKRVHFPVYAPWWPEALAELLRFPNAAHDDFVSFLSLIGQGLLREIKPGKRREPEKVTAVGSIQWIKAAAARERRVAERMNFAKGY